MTDIKVKAVSVKDDTAVIWKSLTRLVEAAALLIVSAYTIYGAYKFEKGKFVFYVLIVAGVTIGMRGAVEFLKYLARKDG